MSTTTDLSTAILEALDDAGLERLAERLAPKLQKHLATRGEQQDGWLDTKGAADYLGITQNALHKHTAARTIPFEQDGPGCKCWFKRSELDAWRCGEYVGAAHPPNTGES